MYMVNSDGIYHACTLLAYVQYSDSTVNTSLTVNTEPARNTPERDIYGFYYKKGYFNPLRDIHQSALFSGFYGSSK